MCNKNLELELLMLRNAFLTPIIITTSAEKFKNTLRLKLDDNLKTIQGLTKKHEVYTALSKMVAPAIHNA